MKGELITSADELLKLADNRKAVVFRDTPQKAAAFFISMPLRVIAGFISHKLLYTYNKK
ncbi:hypothetical protein WAE58_21545 [Pedobacter panaciterrae]|uniref:Short subunit dehydrogenase n=1 Tax=Pedobacter panaciterrae TaxID=363849 RepID=A0ABU8NS05_9SPHI